jgi:hypothetical protein
MYMRHEPEPHVLLFKVKPYRLPPRQRADLFIPRIEGKGLRPKAPTVDGTSFTAPSATTTTRLPGLDVTAPFQQTHGPPTPRRQASAHHCISVHGIFHYHHQPQSPSHAFVLLSLFRHSFGSIGGP